MPLFFWGQVIAVPATAVLVAAGRLLEVLGADAGAPVPTGALVALGIVTLLVVAGELWPVLGARTGDPTGVAWSTTFAFATLLHLGLLAAVVLFAGATVLSGLISGKAAFRWSFNAGQYSLSLAAAWLVMRAFGRAASLQEMWAPTTVADLAVVLLAAGTFFVVNQVLVTGVLCAMTGRSIRTELFGKLSFELAATGAQLALAPLVCVVMHEAPPLTVLGALPVAAIHRSAAAWQQSEYAADHDHLTQLPNRKHLIALTRRVIAEARQSGTATALFVLDLDRFKEVNDVLGHPAGDRLLVEVGRRLPAAMGNEAVVARLGGDEFAVLAPTVTSPDHCLALAARIHAALDEPFWLDGQVIDLDASIGVALFPDHATDFEGLLSKADVAMYAAKRGGDGTGTCLYSSELDHGAAERLGLAGALRLAIDAGQITLEYQPKVTLPRGEMIGVEALARWRRQDGTVVPPDEFVPLAEQSGLMPRLTALVLDQALAQCARWMEQGLHVPVAVNISLRDVLDDSFAHGVAAQLVRFGVPAPMLTLEITERVLASDLPRLGRTLGRLSSLGVQLALDDFGTGWSSLVLLRHLPVTEVKLDRSFVGQVAASGLDAAIVRSVSTLARDLGKTLVAEGVEDAATWDLVAELGCDAAQGWLVARPMPAPAVTEWLRQHAGAEVSAVDAAT
jgi:diguanylate cyclase (GGDEF)-like protein